MKNPHEQEWHEEEGVDGGYVVDASGETVAMVRSPVDRRLLAAAPTLARVALSLSTITDDPDAWTKDGGLRTGKLAKLQFMADDALREAGVLPERSVYEEPAQHATPGTCAGCDAPEGAPGDTHRLGCHVHGKRQVVLTAKRRDDT